MEIKVNRLNKVTNEDIINGIFIFPEYITEIGYECFANVDNLREIIIPPKITHVFDNAFMNCKNLNFCEFQNPYTILENGTFHGCLHLNNVELPTKLKTISCRLFACCSKLSKLEIPNTVSEIGDYAFFATNLMNLTIPDGVPELSKDMFVLCNMGLSIHWKGKYYTYKDLQLYEKFS